MKKIKLLFISFYILTALLYTPNLVFSDEESFAGGVGSENDPYQIENCEQLQNVSSFSQDNYHFILNNDIDCSMTNPTNDNWEENGAWGEGNGFIPIGLIGRSPFSGYFDGNNKKINNLYINIAEEESSPVDSFGLFGYLADNSQIINVGLVDADISGIGKVGGLVGTSSPNTIISNSYVTGNINGTNSENTGNSAAGGLVGINQAHIENSYSVVTVNGENNVGGLVGKSLPEVLPDHTILNSYSDSTVTGINNVGGLVGFNYGDLVKNSFSTGTVVGTTNVGGLVGYLDYDSGVCADYILNSGWFKNNENMNLNSIGLIEGGLVCDNIYTETSKNVFYSKNHGVYAQGSNEAWDFSSPIWYQWDDQLPLFEGQPQPERRKRSSGSSSSLLSAFISEQQAKNSINSTPTIELKPVNPPTLTRIIRKTIPRTTGDDVLAFQKYLNSIGYNIGAEDGVYGTKTQIAVKNFQIANNLSPDGSIGPLTRALMK